MNEKLLQSDATKDPEALRHQYNLLGYLWGGTSCIVNHPTRGNVKIEYLSKRKEIPADGFRGVDRFRIIGDLLGIIERTDDISQLERVEEYARNIQMPDGGLYQALEFTPPDSKTIKRENDMILAALRSRIATLGNIGRIGMWLRNAGKIIDDL